MAEYISLSVGAYHFCHIRRRDKHAVEFVYITVKAGLVLAYNLACVNVSIGCLAFRSCEHLEVVVGNVSLAHLSCYKVGHQGSRSVESEPKAAFFLCAETFPVIDVRFLGILVKGLRYIAARPREIRNGVGSRSRCRLTQTLVFRDTAAGAYVRHHLKQVSIVEH